MQVTVSSKYQVVIPREIRERFGIKPGEKVEIIDYDDHMEFIPVRDIRGMRGFLKGLDTSVERDEERV
jgi:AbrB family looped-hinge helix DNA binding protein